MSRDVVLARPQLDRVRAAAAVLLSGSADSPAPSALLDFDELLHTAAAAMGDREALVAAIDALPPELSWESLSAFANDDPAAFELISLLVVGAYFMSPAVLASLRIPIGKRRPADPGQVVEELSSGILDAVYERGCPVRTLDEVNGAAQ